MVFCFPCLCDLRVFKKRKSGAKLGRDGVAKNGNGHRHQTTTLKERGPDLTISDMVGVNSGLNSHKFIPAKLLAPIEHHEEEDLISRLPIQPEQAEVSQAKVMDSNGSIVWPMIALKFHWFDNPDLVFPIPEAYGTGMERNLRVVPSLLDALECDEQLLSKQFVSNASMGDDKSLALEREEEEEFKNVNLEGTDIENQTIRSNYSIVDEESHSYTTDDFPVDGSSQPSLPVISENILFATDLVNDILQKVLSFICDPSLEIQEQLHLLQAYSQNKINDIDSSNFEKELLKEMWPILIKANNSKLCSTLGCLRRFLLFIEGLKDDEKLQQ
jgi:hypothetical protein